MSRQLPLAVAVSTLLLPAISLAQPKNDAYYADLAIQTMRTHPQPFSFPGNDRSINSPTLKDGFTQLAGCQVDDALIFPHFDALWGINGGYDVYISVD